MRVFIEITLSNNSKEYFNIDEIQSVLEDNTGRYHVRFRDQKHYYSITDEEFLKWKKHVQVL